MDRDITADTQGLTEEERKKMRFMLELFGIPRGNEMVEAMALADFEFKKSEGIVDEKTAKEFLETRARLKKTLERIVVPE